MPFSSGIKDRLDKLVSRIELNDQTLAEELKAVTGSDAARSMSSPADAAKAQHAAAMPADSGLETIVLRAGRPIFPIVNNQVHINTADPGGLWQSRLLAAKASVDAVIPSIGRIEIQNHPMYDWVGTGWFVDTHIIVTNRHVAEIFINTSGNDFRFRQGLAGKTIETSIDMLQEEDKGQELVYRISRLLYIEPEPGPDIAFLVVEPSQGKMPPPLQFEDGPVSERQAVALIGYPARDSRMPDFHLMEGIFGDVYNKKRLAPGQVTNVFSERILHDCSAVGSWSGAALINLNNGKVAGLQSDSRFLEYNSAIPAYIIADILYKARNRVAQVAEDTGPTPMQSAAAPAFTPPKNVVQFNSFQQGLAKASAIITLVRNKKQSLSTGWLLTDSLVVIPDYSMFQNFITDKDGVECYFMNAKNHAFTIPAKQVYTHKREKNFAIEEMEPALLKLEKPVPGVTITLNMSSIQNIDDIYLLHFPGGKDLLQLSVSRLITKSERLLEYAVASKGGSGGGPLFSFDGAIIGMHYATRNNVQLGMTLRSILSNLQKSDYWNEIAQFHGLPQIRPQAEVTKTTTKADSKANQNEKILQGYAVRWSVDPTKLSEARKKLLAPYVIDSDNATRWVLGEDERIRLIQEMGTLKKLRAARGKARIKDEGQKVIDRILKGPPYRIDKIEDDALPFWLQAVTWFQSVVPGLPSSESISAELQKRKLRLRFKRSAGPDFRGRTKELKLLEKWYSDPNSGAMVISGIGGIGKSAVISKFALGLGDETIIFWLDFDRADLAPDKATSVLKILTEQLAAQVDEYTAPTLTTQSWETVAEDLGEQLKKYTGPDEHSLLVLDGFEIAQHSKKYNEIWPLLEKLLQKAPHLKVIVSGRSPVEGLVLNGKKSESISLKGLEEEVARQWLLKHKIRSEPVIHKTYELSKGSPLILKLAARFIDEGGKIDELPGKLPDIMVQGFLYQRIYLRVIDKRLLDVVEDILVLRVISPDIIKVVLHDKIPAKMTPEKVFECILRELSLVPEVAFGGESSSDPSSSGAVMVNIRPEVRAASLKLLEYQRGKRVRVIDQRAVTYYKRKRKKTDSETTELIYHYLRLGKVADAEKLWKPDYIKSLQDNLEDIPEKYPKAKEWLAAKTGTHTPVKMNVEDWEHDAYQRIKELIFRGHLTAIHGILTERRERSLNSRLLIYDAWNLWMEQRPGEAIEKLRATSVKTVSPLIYYERQIIAAKIAYQNADIAQCETILASLRNVHKVFSVRLQAHINAVTIASQIMIATAEQLKHEIELLGSLTRRKKGVYDLGYYIEEFLSSADLILPQLQTITNSNISLSRSRLKIPTTIKARNSFIQQLAAVRNIHPPFRDLQKKLGTDDFDQAGLNSLIGKLSGSRYSETEKDIPHAATIATLGWKRWHLALTGLWFNEVVKMSGSETLEGLQTAFSIAPAITSFRAVTLELPRRSEHLPGFTSLDKYAEFMLRTCAKRFSTAPIQVSREVELLTKRYLDMLSDVNKQAAEYRAMLFEFPQRIRTSMMLPVQELLNMEDPALRSVLYMLLMPNPIEVAGNKILGFPYVFANETYLTQKRSL